MKMVHLKPLTATEPRDQPFVEEDDGRERLLLVEAEGRLYAMNVTSVREVLRARTITRVPATPAVMLGLVNVRGMVVTVLDLVACVRPPVALGMHHVRETPDVTPTRVTPVTVGAAGVTAIRGEPAASIVLLEHGSRVVGLAVRGVHDVRPRDDVPVVPNATLGGQPDCIDL
jgi:chemotaxis signal transduction protein